MRLPSKPTMLVQVSKGGTETEKQMMPIAAYSPFYLILTLTEFSGRKCAGSIDLSFKTMMEAISFESSEMSFDGAFEQIQLIDDMFLAMANSHPFIIKVMEDENLGPITRPLTGMSNQLGMYQRTGGDWYTVSISSSLSGTPKVMPLIMLSSSSSAFPHSVRILWLVRYQGLHWLLSHVYSFAIVTRRMGCS